MRSLAVGIVEDEVIVAEDMKDILTSIGYKVSFIAISVDEAKNLLAKNETDILLIDIFLKGEETGIDLARFVREQYKIPFIFTTSNADRSTVMEAASTAPYGYVLKPFDDRDLFSAIEVGMGHFQAQHQDSAVSPDTENFVVNNALFVRDKKFFMKVKFDEIDYLEADSNYTNIYTSQKKFTLRSTLKEIEIKLPAQQFVRIHKSYIIRLEAMTGINAQFVLVKNAQLPIGRTYHELISSRVNKLSD
ncbi:hypothetical protein WSM22_06610 [Cytophagales bacterium WSM2-2]|nr:hypothetical protein WSM22_06610 [Cytophagales bacterium WSM2-2]